MTEDLVHSVSVEIGYGYSVIRINLILDFEVKRDK